MTFSSCTQPQFAQNSQLMLIMNVNRSTGIQHVDCVLYSIAALLSSRSHVPFIASWLVGSGGVRWWWWINVSELWTIQSFLLQNSPE